MLHSFLPSTTLSTSQHRLRARPSIGLWLVIVLLLLTIFPAAPTSAAPQLTLPTPPGETWRIIQGYGCGTHNDWDYYSLDLANAGGRTYGAPVRAAAEGRFYVWVPSSGTLILNHGGGFYTMYTHMAQNFVPSGAGVGRGAVVGTVGDRGSPGIPHLHFTAFTARGNGGVARQSVPLSFAEGYNLPNIGGCNQHGGKTLVAKGELIGAAPSVQFSSSGEPGRWYNSDLRIEFNTVAAWGGFSQSWTGDPSGEPMFPDASAGYAQLAQAGEGLHTLYVRAWGANGQQTLATFGPVGYDITPPQQPPSPAPGPLPAGATATLRWEAARDGGSGVAGYRVYLGAEAEGRSDWFTAAPQVETPSLAPGRYVLRVQPLDYAGNAGTWTTLSTIEVVAQE